MSEPNNLQKIGSMKAMMELLSDGLWHPGAALEKVGGNRYTSRFNDLRDLGYVFESRSTPEGKFNDWRFIGMGEPRHTARVSLTLSYDDLEAFFERRETTEVRTELVRAYERAKLKHADAVAYQARVRQATKPITSSFFEQLEKIHEEEEDEGS